MESESKENGIYLDFDSEPERESKRSELCTWNQDQESKNLEPQSRNRDSELERTENWIQHQYSDSGYRVEKC